jgi:hypothetical protein
MEPDAGLGGQHANNPRRRPDDSMCSAPQCTVAGAWRSLMLVRRLSSKASRPSPGEAVLPAHDGSKTSNGMRCTPWPVAAGPTDPAAARSGCSRATAQQVCALQDNWCIKRPVCRTGPRSRQACWEATVRRRVKLMLRVGAPGFTTDDSSHTRAHRDARRASCRLASVVESSRQVRGSSRPSRRTLGRPGRLEPSNQARQSISHTRWTCSKPQGVPAQGLGG